MDNLKFTKYLLDNNVRCINIPLKKAGALSILILVRSGSRYEDPNLAGIAHFLEHMFFKGGKKYKNTKEISEKLDGVGGLFNAATDKEEVSFFVKLPGDKAELALDILSDMIINSRFDESDIRKEKKVIFEEIKMYEDSPMYETEELLESLLYKGYSIERPIIGKRKNISKIKQQDFLNYTKKIYNSKNIIIIFSGDTSLISKKIVNRYFGSILNGREVAGENIKELQLTPKLKIKFKKTEQTHLTLGFRFPEGMYSHKNFFAAKVLSVILGEVMSSRLFLFVREKKGLAYRINSYLHSFQETGYLGVSAGVDNKRLIDAIESIIEQFYILKTEKIKDDELKKAKEYIKGKLIISLEDSLNAAMYIGRQELLMGKILNISDIYKKIDFVTSEKIFDLANKNFINSKLNLGLIGPIKNNLLLRKSLNIK